MKSGWKVHCYRSLNGSILINVNKSEFSNGLDLRNRYIHDTNSLDKRHQQNDYIVLLKMFVILVIKINEEFCLQDKISKKGVDFYEL